MLAGWRGLIFHPKLLLPSPRLLPHLWLPTAHSEDRMSSRWREQVPLTCRRISARLYRVTSQKIIFSYKSSPLCNFPQYLVTYCLVGPCVLHDSLSCCLPMTWLIKLCWRQFVCAVAVVALGSDSPTHCRHVLTAHATRIHTYTNGTWHLQRILTIQVSWPLRRYLDFTLKQYHMQHTQYM